MKFHSCRLSAAISRLAAIFLLISFFILQSNPGPVEAGKASLNGPTGSVRFGAGVSSLPNGNYVITDPQYSSGGVENIGAVYLYDGETDALIGALTGVTAGDRVGSGGVKVLDNGDFVVSSPRWNNEAAAMAGAVTGCSGATGCPSTVTAANSLVGSHTNDYVGKISAIDDNYFVESNSVTPVPASGGAYIVQSPMWDGEKGAVTYCANVSSPQCQGEISAANSLVGTEAGERIGESMKLLSGGGYVIHDTGWKNGAMAAAGAVVPCPASAGCTGVITTANSLYGEATGENIGSFVTPLTGGGFVVASYQWGNAYGGLGAVTFCASAADEKCIGKPVSAENSLLGKTTVANTMIGSGGVFALPDGGYLVQSPSWKNDAFVSTGALTYCSVAGGVSSCTGQNVTDANSLTGDQSQDNVGGGLVILPNGAFVATSSVWHNAAGAATYCATPAACMGQKVSAANSLVGLNSGFPPSYSSGDRVGGAGALALSGGGYVVFSPNWDPEGTDAELGAATFCPPSGCTGNVTLANSLTGSKAGDEVGLTNGAQLAGGAIIIKSPNWANGAHSNAGAVTFCGTPGACQGSTVTLSNSVVSDQDNLQYGLSVTPLSNGAYLIAATQWANGAAAIAGALTWCSPAGCQGMTVSASNSLVGGHADDWVGYDMADVGDGLYVAPNDGWQDGDVPGAGAITLCTQAAGCSGAITAENSVIGSVQGLTGSWGYYNAFNTYQYDPVNKRVMVGLPLENKVVFFSLYDPPTAITSAASGVTTNAATLNGMVDANDQSTTVTFEYGPDTDYGSSVAAAQSPLTGTTSTSVSAALSGLTPGATYHYRVKAASLGGRAFGGDQTFTAGVVVATATTGSASSITGGGATLNGTVNANDASTTVTFEYGPSTSYGSSAAAAQNPVTGTTNTAVSAAITGLASNSTYHFRVAAANTGHTSYGEDQTFVSATIAPIVTTGAASSITANSASLHGTVNANNASTTVTFQYGTDTVSNYTTLTADQSPVSGTANSPVSLDVSSLSANTTYYYRVIAENSAGTTNGEFAQFTTPKALPVAQTLGAANISLSGATLHGSVSPNDSLTTVTFQYGLSTAYGSTVDCDSSPLNGDSKTPVSAAVTGLLPYTTYHYRLAAVSEVGSAYGEDQTFYTDPDKVSIAGSAGTAGVTLTYLDGTTKTVTVNSDGTFTLLVPALWSGTISPAKTGYTFTPSSWTPTNPLSANWTDLVFAPSYTAPGIQNATNIDIGAFTAHWDACPGAAAYYLDVATDADFTEFVSGYQNRDVGLQTAMPLTGLKDGTQYYYRVRASDGALVSANSATASVRTPWVVSLPFVQK